VPAGAPECDNVNRLWPALAFAATLLGCMTPLEHHRSIDPTDSQHFKVQEGQEEQFGKDRLDCLKRYQSDSYSVREACMQAKGWQLR